MKSDTKEKEAALTLIGMSGIGNRTAMRLTECAGSATEALKMSENEVTALLGSAMAKKFLAGREQADKNGMERINREGMDFIPFTMREYPERLRHIPDPPFGLYVKGRLPKEGCPTVAIVGARACSEYGKSVAYLFGKKLGAYGVQVISGMARGIDGISQQGALDGGGDTFAVLGCGADCCYPPENAKLYQHIISQGGVLSEYSPGTQPQNRLFPARNRIISGLSDILVVVEARKRSGTYITVMQALEQNRDVYTVPGRITDALSEGCNYLLTQGAGVAVGPDAILEELSNRHYEDWSLRRSGAEDGKEEYDTDGKIKPATDRENEKQQLERIILGCLELTPLDLESIYEKVSNRIAITMQELMVVLTRMQICGRVESCGNYYRLSLAL